MGGVVLLTGATGFLGAQVARRLLAQTDHDVVALVRAADRRAAARRLARAWWDWPELAAQVIDAEGGAPDPPGDPRGGVAATAGDGRGGRVLAVAGDLRAPGLGLDPAAWRGLARRVTHIVHTAADLRLTAPLDELRRTNVAGVANLLELARAARRDHGLARLTHVSTAYVAGLRPDEVPEDGLTDRFGFANGYERSKYEGERLVRAARGELPVTVVRPAMIVGDARTGAVRTFNTFYVPLRRYLARRRRLVPVRRGLRVNIVPVDWVADAVVRLTFDPAAEGRTVHLTAPFDSLPTAAELVGLTRRWAAEHLGVRLPRPLFVPLPAAALGELRALVPYLAERRRFRRDHADRLLGRYQPDWRAYLPRLLAYACAHGFMHRCGRTVHEQVLHRLTGRSRPVTYQDLGGTSAVGRDAGEVRAEMLAAAGALRRLGVRPGDRVALVGVNSTRYLTVDVAVGLAGAVGVPLHPTSPPAELDEILAVSGARLLLVGAPDVLARLGELRSRLPVVSFRPGPTPAGVVGWDAFLALGRRGPDGGPHAPLAPVGPDDLATIRYTSGTTGRPKGVAFTHRQLRWMAETLASLLPWPARTRPASYLSFLPMNHVVEGILATYAPYWLPAPVRIAFLDDFRQVREALPKVRPTIFFSVPRLYEKAWAALAAGRLGRRYLHGAHGLERRLEREVLRRALLRRAGLDRCAQLVVGSAPASPDLLARLHDLGIEVHDAYGLTEAPLVTLNRHGRNRIGTVGEPLPETAVRIAPDGEVLVRGPQVTPGYVDAGDGALTPWEGTARWRSDPGQPFRDGWLATGDLGHLTPDGLLVVNGRRKELLKTSYGKYLHPARVEALLRELPGVAEAMVVGEGRPYCVALLWTDTPGGPPAGLDEAMAEVNARLERPQQVRRWRVLPDDLSVERGDLTVNLKLRRTVVAERLREDIAALYDQPSGVHPGGFGGPEQVRVPRSVRGSGGPEQVRVPRSTQAAPAMSLTLRLMEHHVPAVARRAALRALFATTAEAFGAPVPPLAGLSADELLRRYARFTREQAEGALRGGRDLPALQARLEWGARALGSRLRTRLRIRTTQEALVAARVVYRLLDIDFDGTAHGEVTVRHCSFSAFYRPEVCRLVGALDEGLLAGLTGGHRLAFTQRITEGAPVCLARLLPQSTGGPPDPPGDPHLLRSPGPPGDERG
ncbi:MAG TPA: AMP-binding protein [Actinomycetes bacterium]|nr:AMP-binding protein [Actinomycetes bacterium]